MGVDVGVGGTGVGVGVGTGVCVGDGGGGTGVSVGIGVGSKGVSVGSDGKVGVGVGGSDTGVCVGSGVGNTATGGEVKDGTGSTVGTVRVAAVGVCVGVGICAGVWDVSVCVGTSGVASIVLVANELVQTVTVVSDFPTMTPFISSFHNQTFTISATTTRRASRHNFLGVSKRCFLFCRFDNAC